MRDKKPFTVELDETAPIPHPAEVDQINDAPCPLRNQCHLKGDWVYLVGLSRLGPRWFSHI